MSTIICGNDSQSFAQRELFLVRVEQFVKRPRWTPAEGALLVNGVVPPAKGCKDIPATGDKLYQLDEPSLPANLSQLGGARRVLQELSLIHI